MMPSEQGKERRTTTENLRKPAKDLTTIRLGIGMGKLRFGATRDEVRAYLGEPEQVSPYQYDKKGEDTTEAWYYWSQGISAHFNSDDDFRLTSLMAEAPPCTLHGLNLIGKKKEPVLEKLRELGIADGIAEDMSNQDKPDLELISFDSVGLELWFDNGRLDTIQWSYLFEADDETPIWPDAEK